MSSAVPSSSNAVKAPTSSSDPKAVAQKSAFHQKVCVIAKACGYSQDEIQEGVQQVTVGDKQLVLCFFPHTGAAHAKFEDFYRKRALSKQCAYMEEGVLRDPAYERRYIEITMKKEDPGFYYGLEDEISHARHALFNLFEGVRAVPPKCSADDLLLSLLESCNNPVMNKLFVEHTKQQSTPGSIAAQVHMLCTYSNNDVSKILGKLNRSQVDSLVCGLLKDAFADASPSLREKLGRLLNLFPDSIKMAKENNLDGLALSLQVMVLGRQRLDAFVEELRTIRDPLYAKQICKMAAKSPHSDLIVILGKNHKAGVLSALKEQGLEKKSDSIDRKDDKKA